MTTSISSKAVRNHKKVNGNQKVKKNVIKRKQKIIFGQTDKVTYSEDVY